MTGRGPTGQLNVARVSSAFWYQFLKEYNYVNILMHKEVRVTVPFSPPNQGFSAKPQSLPKRG
jgi:hypothetical protein